MATRIPGFLATLLALATLPAFASAQSRDDLTESVRSEDARTPNAFMLTARMRAVAFPDLFLGLFFDEHASHWSRGQRNFSYGGEFVWRRGLDLELGLAIDYADLTMPEDFWLEAGDGAQSADWTEIDMQLLSVVFSAYWFWNVQPWLTPYLGGGIGPGFLLGDVVRYEPNRQSGCYSDLGYGNGDLGFTDPNCLRPDGQPSENAVDYDNPNIDDRIPSVVPIIHLSAGLRFNLDDYAVLKLEAGFYTYLFAGASLGVHF